MRITASLLSLVIGTATLGGCAARAGVRVADANSKTPSGEAVAKDDQKAAPAQGSGDTAPGTEPEKDEQAVSRD